MTNSHDLLTESTKKLPCFVINFMNKFFFSVFLKVKNLKYLLFYSRFYGLEIGVYVHCIEFINCLTYFNSMTFKLVYSFPALFI